MYRRIVFHTPERSTCRNVRKTRGGHYLVLANPTGAALLSIDVRPMLRRGDGIATVDVRSEACNVDVDKDPDGLAIRFADVRHSGARGGRDYGGTYGSLEDNPNVLITMGLISGESISVPIMVRNHNKPLEHLIGGSRVLTPAAELQSVFGPSITIETTREREDLRDALRNASTPTGTPDRTDPVGDLTAPDWVGGQYVEMETPNVDFGA